MSKNYTLIWDLDSIYSGGSGSEELATALSETANEIALFKQAVSNWPIPGSKEDVSEFLLLINQNADITKQLMNAAAFLECLSSADTRDLKAVELTGSVYQQLSELETIENEWHEKFALVPDALWTSLLTENGLSEIAFVLNEARDNRKKKGTREEEAVINALSVDGYRGWSDHYDTVVATIRIPVVIDGEEKQVSAGQALNLLSHPDRTVRVAVFEAYGKAWQEQSQLFSDTLNHLAGFRLAVYRARKWDDVLAEPLAINRLDEKTLATMWEVIEKHKTTFVAFLNRKAQLFDIEKLSFHDVFAPLTLDSEPKKYTYQEGADFILTQFAKFSPKMASFAKHAFEQQWIEAEDRDNKRPGGFCTDIPMEKESRIFMTYDGAPGTVATLAHELGHAFHSHVIREEPFENTNYAMNVAETASTFAEMIIADASVKEAATKEEKIILLEDKIGRSIAFFMDIRARFLFETRFYEARKKGIVSADRLNEIMKEAQREAYQDALSEYHPQFWSSKLHFYIADVPFYNFPYTFGYLFSLGIYHQAIVEGSGYEDKYIALLQDTGAMTTEQLAQKHLNIDLTKPDFWESALAIAVGDVEEFLDLTNDLV
ncbi:M3 family oligoendopeptidase [Paenilisteria rocourtiae]|uniref:PepF/M3 family oligoendopeptidase n=1 Tax=Listeria rocourtiae TaxID=647910 RepID=A0A4R6ZNE0_9LIST|nr:M3 family oligoendopeptidase [Listeria rocourtiae]EUJ51610.1 oligoendopeptidase F [Listeria rocourtiae FSL F6-920]MBC1603855.1 M3 family oligoendopeptidase [Listeria rocourtiae]TDR53639.1 pepF/M3 family oligoendopeptidase [Listeria rocourtiae]